MDPFAFQLKRRLLSQPLSKIQTSSRAAVAAVISLDQPRSLLLMRRAEHPHDPWSGHMSFPGGRAESGETDLEAALRELHEEVGLDLGKSRVLGRLSDVQAGGHDKIRPMAVAPFVFGTRRELPCQLDENEVQEVVWVPLSYLRDRSQLRTMIWKGPNVTRELPCYIWNERRIWGLTFRMIQDLLSHLGDSRHRPGRALAKETR